VDLANLILRGIAGSRSEDRLEAHRWLEQAAQSGDAVAAFNYGLCLAEGAGVERDDRQAAQWLRRAAAELPGAQYWFGRMLVDGRGVDADVPIGRAWIARAAAVGIADAEAALAEMMINGRGGPRDPAGAVPLLESAAAKGHVGAMFALGALKSGGYGVPSDRAIALHWLRMAAERGHAEAQAILGRYLTAAPEQAPAACRFDETPMKSKRSPDCFRPFV
jgi:TPR repeat protein